MTIFIAPDKFKGSLTTFEVCAAIESGLKLCGHDIQTRCFPMADGGDGFAAVLKHYWQTETIRCEVADPLGRYMEASYEWQPSSRRAIIEVASASGMALLHSHELDVLHASTFGTGLLVADAIQKGASEIVLGLGGSATNDAGTGILAALGWTFMDAEGNALAPCGASLAGIHTIAMPASLPGVRFTIACDVQNPLYGPGGAAHVYARQKGADDDIVERLDAGLMHYAAQVKKLTAVDVNIPGAGAAGGIAASLLPWFGTSMVSGADLVLEASGILSQLQEADWLITGEGRFDGQSLQGKLLSRLLSAAHKYEVPVAVLCGKIDMDELECFEAGLAIAKPVCQPGMAIDFCMKHAAELLLLEAKSLGTALTK